MAPPGPPLPAALHWPSILALTSPWPSLRPSTLGPSFTALYPWPSPGPLSWPPPWPHPLALCPGPPPGPLSWPPLGLTPLSFPREVRAPSFPTGSSSPLQPGPLVHGASPPLHLFALPWASLMALILGPHSWPSFSALILGPLPSGPLLLTSLVTPDSFFGPLVTWWIVKFKISRLILFLPSPCVPRILPSPVFLVFLPPGFPSFLAYLGREV